MNSTWPLIAATVLALIACAVWALILIGAWLSSLDGRPPFIGRFALKEKYAAPVMKAMVRELIALVVAVSLFVVATLRMARTQEAVERTTAQLLCRVKGEGTPDDVRIPLRELENIPSELKSTVLAYNAYLSAIGMPDADTIKKIYQGAKLNAFDHRVLGLANHMMAARMTPKLEALQKEYYGKAKSHYSNALALCSTKSLPGSPSEAFVSSFEKIIRAAQAGITMGLAQFEPAKSMTRSNLFAAAITDYVRIKNSGTKHCQIYLNLAGAFSELGAYDSKNYQEAINVLREVQRSGLDDNEKRLVKPYALDLFRMEEFIGLSNYVEHTFSTNWAGFVESFVSPVK
jgi:hypothetical protein